MGILYSSLCYESVNILLSVTFFYIFWPSCCANFYSFQVVCCVTGKRILKTPHMWLFYIICVSCKRRGAADLNNIPKEHSVMGGWLGKAKDNVIYSPICNSVFCVSVCRRYLYVHNSSPCKYIFILSFIIFFCWHRG